jgi:hypothetical protein
LSIDLLRVWSAALANIKRVDCLDLFRCKREVGDGVGAAAGFEDFCNDGFLIARIADIAPTADFVCDSNFPVIRPMFPY